MIPAAAVVLATGNAVCKNAQLKGSMEEKPFLPPNRKAFVAKATASAAGRERDPTRTVGTIPRARPRKLCAARGAECNTVEIRIPAVAIYAERGPTRID